MIVQFDVPDAVIPELNKIALEGGFANAKQMVIAYLKAQILAYRKNKVIAPARAMADAIPDDVEIG